MRATHIAATVVGAGVLAAVLLWLTTSTVEAPTPHAVGGNNPCASAANTDRPLAPPPKANEPADDGGKPLAGPPPQVIVNDPSSGRVWLRVVDADTGRPLANQRVELLPAGRVSASDYFYMEEEDRPRPEPRATDGAGLIDFTAVVQEGDESDAEVIVEDLQNAANLIHVPVPDGWYPTIEPRELAEKLRTLLDKPTEDAIDFAVRRYASLSVKVGDYAGLPVAGALLALNLEPDDTVARDWVSYKGAPAGIKIDDYLSYTSDLYIDMVPEQFRLSINGEVKYPEERDEGQMEELGFHEPGALGTEDIADLVRGNAVAVAFHPLYGMVSGRLELQGGQNTIELRFPQATTGELHVQLNWLPAPEDPEEIIEIELFSSGPYGRAEPMSYAGGADVELQWEIPAGGATTELVFTGIPAGRWQVVVKEPFPGAGASVDLAAGESKEMQLYLGEQAACRWTPIVRCDGEPLNEVEIVVIGGPGEWRGAYQARRDAEGKPRPVDIAPGEWTAVLPSLRPLRFALQPGEERQDVFELKTVEVNFSITSALSQALNNSAATATELELVPRGVWYGRHEVQDLLEQRMLEANRTYNLIAPGEGRTWRILPGEYEWHLNGDVDELEGRIVIGRVGTVTVEFDTANLPGYDVLEVEMKRFESDEEVEFTIADAWDLRMEPAPHVVDHWMYLDDPPQLENDLSYRLRAQILKMSNEHYLVFAPPGEIAGRVRCGELQHDFFASVPGKLTVDAADVQQVVMRDVWFVETLVNRDDPYADENYFDEETSELKDIDYDIEAFGVAGWHGHVDGSGFEEMPRGRMALVVHRMEYSRDESCRNLIVRIDLEVGDGTNIVELAKLEYQPYAMLDLVLKGRGSPEQDHDAWWFGERGPRAPMLIALDWHNRVVQLSWVSEYLPEGRLEISFRRMLLPPGRYHLIPWPDAPANKCRVFTLEPGETRTIELQGS